MASPLINVGGRKHGRTLLTLFPLVRRPDLPISAAEIGVYRGDLSAFLLSSVPDLHLSMVDSWAEVPDGDYRKTGDKCAQLTQADHDENYAAAIEAVRFADARARIFRCPSVQAAGLVADGLDLAFIDGDHSESGVRADIAAWWPKVRAGGILSGHDFSHRRRKSGVVRAVEAFVAENGLELQLGGGSVWWVLKQKAEA